MINPISTEDLVELLSHSHVDSTMMDRVLDIVLANIPERVGAVFALAAGYAPIDPTRGEKPEDMPRLCFRAALELDADTAIAAMLSVPFELNGNPVILTCDDGNLRIVPFISPY